MVQLLLASLLLQTNPQADTFRFAEGQRVYVVAVSAISRDLSATSAYLGLERLAKDQFKKAGVFKIATTLRSCDFVFFVIASGDELALAVLPSDYERAGNNLDALRNVALWQGDSHLKVGREAGLAWATGGVSLIFHRPSLIRNLVKQFHADTVSKKRAASQRNP